MNNAQATEQALQILRSGGNFQWTVIGVLFSVNALALTLFAGILQWI